MVKVMDLSINDKMFNIFAREARAWKKYIA